MMQDLLREVTLNKKDDTADILDKIYPDNWISQVLRHHALKGEDRTPEFICLAGIAGTIGNIIIGEYNTYDKSEEAESILGRAQMMTYFDQASRTKKLPMINVIVQGMNLAKNYLTDLLTKSEGGFRERVSTAMSYLTIAARPIFDHIPTPTEQKELPTTTPFFINHVMRHEGITSRNSILRQILTTLGKDNIINMINLKPSPNNNPYHMALYTLNLFQAGGFNTWYFRSREGTQDTLNKTAFIMATGHSRILDCTEDPAQYGLILSACEHKKAQTCMQFHPSQFQPASPSQFQPATPSQSQPATQSQFHPSPEDQTGQDRPSDQNQMGPPEQNKACITDKNMEQPMAQPMEQPMAQHMAQPMPVSVIKITRPRKEEALHT